MQPRQRRVAPVDPLTRGYDSEQLQRLLRELPSSAASSTAAAALDPPTRSYDAKQLQRLLQPEPVLELSRSLPSRPDIGTATHRLASDLATVALTTQRPTGRSRSSTAEPHGASCARRETAEPSEARTRRLPSPGVLAMVGVTLLVAGALASFVLSARKTTHSSAQIAAPRQSPPAASPSLLAPAEDQFRKAPGPRSNAVAARDATAASPTEAPSQELAATALASGRYVEALAAYRELARARPEQPAFAAIATILQRRLASRCKNGLDSGGTPCVEGSQ
jgi:hypothetical protein